jgi:hypothetical protein|uniref:Uncharacterized protein n=1 Tax=Burkholderia sp. (strain CCGE1003) TaxID=640512 RepID=E1TIS1_BURSG
MPSFDADELETFSFGCVRKAGGISEHVPPTYLAEAGIEPSVGSRGDLEPLGYIPPAEAEANC